MTTDSQYCIKYGMVHLNITIDEELYERLKTAAPSKKMSAWIAAAIQAKLRPSHEELARGYQESEQERASDPELRALVADWSAFDGEGWPDE